MENAMQIALDEAVMQAMDVLKDFAPEANRDETMQLVTKVLDHEHDQYVMERFREGHTKILRVQVNKHWLRVDSDELPENADPATLTDLAMCSGTTRPLHYAKTALNGILVSLPLIPGGRTDFYAAHWVHRQWLQDNAHRKASTGKSASSMSIETTYLGIKNKKLLKSQERGTSNSQARSSESVA